MGLRPGRRFVLGAFALAAASVSLFATDAAGGPLALGAAMLVSAALADAVWLWRNRDAAAASVECPGTAVRGDEVLLTIRLTNGASRRIALAARVETPDLAAPPIVRFETRLGPGEHTAFEARQRLPERGVYRWSAVHLRMDGPMGLMRLTVERPVTAECRVYPDIRRVRDHIVTRRLHDAIAPHLRTARIRGIGSEFESLREYEDGDDIRRIDWRASARYLRPIVRNYEIEPFRTVMVLVDAGRLMAQSAGDGAKLDHAIDAALMVAGVALDGGDRCGALVFDDQLRAYLPPRGGLGQLRAVVETLFDVKPTFAESHFQRAFVQLQTRLRKRSLIVILGDVTDVDASASLLSGVVALSRRHLVVFAALRTPEVQAVIDAPSRTVADPYEKAVAYRLLEDRAAVMARMHKSGVQVLDVEPERVTVPLVNKYLELREANRL